jgi:3'-5' exoribonuclease
MHLLLHARHDPQWNQLTVLEARPASEEDRMFGYDPADFEATTRFDVEALFSELLDFAKKIGDEALRKLVLAILWKHESEIKAHPAAIKNHHAFKGGYLEHVVSVTRTGEYLANKYAEYYSELSPPLNKDLILAGCILHDVGKVYELEVREEGTAYTVPGTLIGHVLIGRDMVREAAGAIESLSPELLMLLEHVIIAHHGQQIFDSPKVPMIPEAMLVHYADEMDAKMNMYVAAVTEEGLEGPFTNWNRALDRKLLRERTV